MSGLFYLTGANTLERLPDAPQILLVEDNRADVMLVEEALRLHQVDALLHVVDDGEKAILLMEELDGADGGRCPDLFLLDLNLPRKSGMDVLEYKRGSARCRSIPVIVITSSDSVRDRTATRRLGANHYFRKPASLDEFMEIGRLVRRILNGADHASGAW